MVKLSIFRVFHWHLTLNLHVDMKNWSSILFLWASFESNLVETGIAKATPSSMSHTNHNELHDSPKRSDVITSQASYNMKPAAPLLFLLLGLFVTSPFSSFWRNDTVASRTALEIVHNPSFPHEQYGRSLSVTCRYRIISRIRFVLSREKLV